MSTMVSIQPTVGNAIHAPTIKSFTGEQCSLQLARFINPLNEDEVIVHYKDFALVVNKRLWNLLSVNAKVQRVESFEEFKNSLNTLNK